MVRLLLVALIWGWSFLFIKVIVEGAPPLFVAWTRVALGALVLLAFLRSYRERLPGREHWFHVTVLGVLMSVIPFSLIAWGEERITSALASVLNAATPLFAAAAAAVLLGERLRPPQLAGLGVGFAGVAVVAGVGGGDLAASSLLGSLAVLGAAASYGTGFGYVQRFLSGLTPTQMAAGPLAAATVVLAAPTAVAVIRQGVQLSPLRVVCVLALGCLGTGYALMLNYRTVKELGPTTASLVTYLVPVVGVTAGVLVLGEPFSFRLILGGLLIVLSVALVQGRLLGAPREERSGVRAGAR
ncbi:MAG TPA: DMT family transporter [Actinomycetes bacterium]|nr:DMT family transporter [Actinomycetes bacterium]